MPVGTERRSMHRFIYDWFELERLEKAAFNGELDEEMADIDIADLRRNKLIMYKVYQEMIEKRLETEKDFWEAVYPIDATRAALIAQYGEEEVLEVESDTYEINLALADIERALNRSWEEFEDPETELEVNEEGNIVQNRNSVFELNEEAGQTSAPASLQDIARKYGFTRKQISAIGLAASAAADVSGDYDREEGETMEHRASINYEKFANRLVNAGDPFNAEFIVGIHNLASKAIKESLIAYDNGDPAKLGKLLREGIKKTSEMFADARDPQDATKRAGQLKKMLEILENHPDVAEAANLNEEERSAAYGAVNMGEMIYKGLSALHKMQEAALSMTELPDNLKDSYSQDIFQMQFVLNDRNRQIEVFRDSPGMKLPPSELQKGIGNNARVLDLKTGKWPKLVTEIRTAIKTTDAYRRMTRSSTFSMAHMMGSRRRRTISMSEILREISSKTKDAQLSKEQRQARRDTVIQEPVIESPIIAGPLFNPGNNE